LCFMLMNITKTQIAMCANAKNLFVTFAYIAIWVFVIFISIKHKSLRVIKYCLSFWILTFFFSLLTTYINVTEGLANWAIPFVIILLAPLYGIRFLVNDFLILSIVIAVISFVISIATILLFRQINKQMVS